MFVSLLASIALAFTILGAPPQASAQSISFKPEDIKLGNYGVEVSKANGTTTIRPELVWAGGASYPEFNGDFGELSDVGWAWCIDRHAQNPAEDNDNVFASVNAQKMTFTDANIRNAAITVASLTEEAYKSGNYDLAARYSIYQAALLGESPSYRMNALRDIYGAAVEDGMNARNL